MSTGAETADILPSSILCIFTDSGFSPEEARRLGDALVSAAIATPSAAMALVSLKNSYVSLPSLVSFREKRNSLPSGRGYMINNWKRG